MSRISIYFIASLSTAIGCVPWMAILLNLVKYKLINITTNYNSIERPFQDRRDSITPSKCQARVGHKFNNSNAIDIFPLTTITEFMKVFVLPITNIEQYIVSAV